MRTEQHRHHLGFFRTKIRLHKFVRPLQQIESLNQIGRITIYKCFVRFRTSAALEKDLADMITTGMYVSSLV